MPTTSVSLTVDAWTLVGVAPAIVQAADASAPVEVILAAALPALTDKGLRLQDNSRTITITLAGNVYARAGQRPTSVAVLT
jgi:hypothetical protein